MFIDTCKVVSLSRLKILHLCYHIKHNAVKRAFTEISVKMAGWLFVTFPSVRLFVCMFVCVCAYLFV